MCDPASAAAALAIAGGVMEWQEANANYSAQVDANNKTRVSAVKARDLQISQTQLRNQQEQDQLADEKFGNLLKGIETSSAFRTAAGEDNIVGRSIQHAMNDRVADRLRNSSKLSTQSNYINQNASVDAQGIQAQLEGRLASVVDPIKPNATAAIVKTSSSALGAYGGVGGDTKWGEVFTA